MTPTESLIAFLLTLATLAIFASVQPAPPPADWTDTGVGCLDECLDPEPFDTRADAEPIRADQEERP